MKNLVKKDLPVLRLLFGAAVIGLAYNMFLIPYKIAPGGVSGIATVIYHVTGGKIPVGATMLAFNIPLFIMGLKAKGRKFILRSFAAAFFLSVFIDITAPLMSHFTRSFLVLPGSAASHDLLLYSLAGGFITGIGLGFIFSEDATTGGTDMGAVLLHKVIPWVQVGKCLIILDGLVILIAVIVFKSFYLGLYSVVALFVSARTLDGFLEGINFSKSLMIISHKSEEIADRLIKDVDRGVTGIYGKGMYTKNPYMILLCVVKKEEIHKVKDIVKQIDPSAFVLLTDVREVLGEGFTPHQKD
ncbi:MAG: YitT family protein [Clostridiaceae bacterium]|nr:YitT family protein [Clostridiaceae bacterium]